MEKYREQRNKILRDVVGYLSGNGAPIPSLTQLSAGADISRQHVRYYFDDPTDMMLGVCEHLAEAYRMALVNGVERLEGPKRLSFILDFYFDLVADNRKPRDDRAYDAMMAYAGTSPRVRDALRDQYALLGHVLALEIKMVHPHLTFDTCAEISYLFVCLMYGHWKMVASLGLAEDHARITRRAIDRIIETHALEVSAPKDWPRAWAPQD